MLPAEEARGGGGSAAVEGCAAAGGTRQRGPDTQQRGDNAWQQTRTARPVTAPFCGIFGQTEPILTANQLTNPPQPEQAAPGWMEAAGKIEIKVINK